MACGAGDNAAAALALSFAPGEAALSLGTSGTVYAPSAVPSADPTGTVAGFASADGRFLPLACTLNATVAIDRTCEWLELSREDVAPSEGVVFLPWLGGERTPNAPTATGTMTGLRYQTDKRAILQAAYEGLVATLLEATAFLDQWAPQSMDAPLLLLGGGGARSGVARNSGPSIGTPVARCGTERAGCLWSGRPGQRRPQRETPGRGGGRLGSPARCVAPPRPS